MPSAVSPRRKTPTQDLSSKDTADLNTKIQTLVNALQSSLEDLKADQRLQDALHNHERLPDKETARLADVAIDLLHETEQLLEPGPLVLADHFLGFLDSKCLVAAVELNVPDALGDDKLTLSELADRCDARSDRLGQVLRVLRNKGIFGFDKSTNRYNNNSTSKLLLSDHWTQWRNWVDLYGKEFYDMARAIPAQCRKSETRMAGQIQYDTDKSMFQYFIEQGLLPRMHKTLSGGAIAQAPGIVADYPWSELANSTILDIGGGQGGLVASVLREFPNMKGGIFDLAPVIERAKQSFHEKDGVYADVGSRVSADELIVGDFLVSIPEREVYTMKWCLHDWDDSRAVTVLKNIRTSIKRGPLSRLVIFESILDDGRSKRLTRYADITMMISANGQERDLDEWNALAGQTGWKLSRVFHLRNAWPCAIEFVPVWEESLAVFRSNSALLPDDPIVTSEMSFLEPWDPAKGEPFYRSAPDEGYETSNLKWEAHNVTVTDVRPIKEQFTIQQNGFEYIDDPAGISQDLLEQLRKNDKELTKKVYHPRIEKLVKTHTGASRVIIFDDTVRKRDPGLDKHENPNGREQPATVVHCDQSGKGARGRLAQNLGETESLEEILKGRVQLINVWRPLVGPIVDWPLATMDFQTLKPENSHPCSLWRGAFTDRGQTMTFEFDGDQKWYYLKHHRVDEVTLIKIWDSWGTPGGEIAECCPHAAFKHPGTPESAAPRESIEVRCLAIFDP